MPRSPWRGLCAFIFRGVLAGSCGRISVADCSRVRGGVTEAVGRRSLSKESVTILEELWRGLSKRGSSEGLAKDIRLVGVLVEG